MVTLEDFSRLVSGIHAAAVTPQGWESALYDVRQAMGGSQASLVSAPADVWSINATTLPETALDSYAAYYHRIDYVLTEVRAGKVGDIRCGTELVAPQRHSEFHNDWLRPNDIGDGIMVLVNAVPAQQCLIVAGPPRTEAFDTSERRKLLGSLIRHVQQALRVQAAVSAQADINVQLAEALEAVRHGMVIVTPECLVVHINSAAEHIVASNDGLCLRSGRLASVNTGTECDLQSALRDAVDGDPSGIRSGRSFSCARPSGKHAYVLHVLPIHGRDADYRGAPTAALVVIVDPEDDPLPPEALLGSLYGLTRTETRIALGVLRGADPRHIAEEMSVSLTTVRTHLQHVFDKTDTHRQADLVRLLMRLGP
jgi:DNA-binding CsgD family transcriptional regulator